MNNENNFFVSLLREIQEMKESLRIILATKVHFGILLVGMVVMSPTLVGTTEHEEQEPDYEPLVTTLGTRAFDVAYELWYYVNVVFESEVEAKNGGFEYRYRLTNKGDSQVRVEWRGLEESVFGKQADNIEELRMGLLNPGAVSDWLVLTSSSRPQVSERAARMFGSAPSGNESVQFSGPAPAYVPE